MLDESARQMLRRDADMLRSTNRNGETSMSRVEAFERLFGHLPKLIDELEKAEAAIERVRDKHSHPEMEGGRQWCRECDYQWPCPTIAALDTP